MIVKLAGLGSSIRLIVLFSETRGGVEGCSSGEDTGIEGTKQDETSVTATATATATASASATAGGLTIA